jgi:hypothetical protein
MITASQHAASVTWLYRQVRVQPHSTSSAAASFKWLYNLVGLLNEKRLAAEVESAAAAAVNYGCHDAQPAPVMFSTACG